MNLNSLIVNTKVSSVLHDDVKTYGKQFLFDGREDTCWNSEAGLPQSIIVQFSKSITLSSLHLMFQGGFVGIDCELSLIIDGSRTSICKLYPEDINDLQTFQLKNSIDVHSDQKLEVQFNQSSDFYGRITVYMIVFEGQSV